MTPPSVAEAYERFNRKPNPSTKMAYINAMNAADARGEIATWMIKANIRWADELCPTWCGSATRHGPTSQPTPHVKTSGSH